MNMSVQVSHRDPAFISSGYIQSGIVVSYGNSMFNFGGTISH